MFRLFNLLLAGSISATLTACNERPIDSDCNGMCDIFGPAFPGVGECHDGACTPTFDECFAKDEFTTCDQACVAQASACVENGCAGYTYLIHSNVASCEDPTKVGVGIEHGCAEPIDWQVNGGAQCCCEQ